jgi:hypothetical protein
MHGVNYIQFINTLYVHSSVSLNVKLGGTYSYQCALWGLKLATTMLVFKAFAAV